ncbi:putative phosphoglycerate mutase [Psilocybe cubensis]|uniref:Phosphoglycerate mutase n=2 Tax=Psilocybe cubensis TaxID=181762 RepID=A0ACB8GWD9_PSICU|nr:putative phosphoglycerate mutase [Psilocybe cubensis]KAH9480063.1 putative phosphoglycerate mutase [Psilocybe cubensis]
MSFPTRYESVPGFFVQDDAHAIAVAVPPRLGLKDASDDRWPKFLALVEKLNAESPPDVSYKFFLLIRHGQGYHNVGEAKYGSVDWDLNWSRINGDDEMTWGPDPLLTPLGKQQAADVQREMVLEAAAGLPPPHKRYCSPFSRALDTCDIAFAGVYEEHPYPVLVVEDCREENGVHTCDKRNTRSYIANYKPHFLIEEGLTELDDLWDPNVRETKEEVSLRARSIIDRVFANDTESYYISITSHSGFITGFLQAIGRERYPLPTGGIVLTAASNVSGANTLNSSSTNRGHTRSG